MELIHKVISDHNLKHLVRVTVADRKVNRRYQWREKKSWLLGLFTEKEGFYDGMYPQPFVSIDEIKREGHIVEGRIVYWRPYVQAEFSNKECNWFKRFDTYQEALKVGSEIKEKTSTSWWTSEKSSEA